MDLRPFRNVDDRANVAGHGQRSADGADGARNPPAARQRGGRAGRTGDTYRTPPHLHDARPPSPTVPALAPARRRSPAAGRPAPWRYRVAHSAYSLELRL